MVSDKSLFQRLKKNFSTDVVIRNIGGGKLKVLDVENILSYGQLQTNSLIDRFTRLHRAGQNMQYNPTLNYQTLRIQLYSDYDIMDYDPILSTTLDILSEEATLEGDKKEVLSIRSSDENIQSALYNLFYDVLNVPFSLPMWIRSMAKYGDFYLKLELAEKYGVYGAKPLYVYDMIREEGNDPNNPGYIRYIHDTMAVAGGTQSSKNRQVYENYEIAHFRNLTDTNHLPYGRSYLEPARKLFKQYILMLDAMLIHRIMRAPEKRIFFVNVGNIPPNEVNAFMQQHVNALKKTPYIDPQTGDYNLKFNMQNMMEDFHVPIRPGDTTTRIDTAKGLEYDGIKDVEFLRDLMLAAVKVPKAILNYSDELNGKCIHPDTKIPLLSGETKTIKEISDLFESDEDPNLWVYSYDSKTDAIIPGKVVLAKKTRLDAKLVKVTLDNGESLITTPDHGFVLKGGEKIEAQYLTEGTSLQAVYREFKKIRNQQNPYEHVYQPNVNKWETTHKMVDNWLNNTIEDNGYDSEGKFVRDNLIVLHHKDFNRNNNHPDNLQRCTFREHSDIHIKNAENGIWSDSAKKKAKDSKNTPEYKSKAKIIGQQNMAKQCEKDPNVKFRVRDAWQAKTFEERSEMTKARVTDATREKLRKIGEETYKIHGDNLQKAYKEKFNGVRLDLRGENYCKWVERPSIDTIVEFIKNYDGDIREINTPKKLSNKFGYSLHVFEDALWKGGWDIAEFFNEYTGFLKGRKPTLRREYLIELLSGFENVKQLKEKYKFDRGTIRVFKKILGDDIKNYVNKTYNHKVVKVEFLDYTSDTYNMEVWDKNENHNFLTSAGIIIKNSTISALDLRFSHTVEKIQRLVISELKKIAFIHLYILGYEDSDLVNFTLSMNNPSLIDAQEKVALMKEKVALHKEMKETGDFSSDWIMDKIWDMSEDEIVEERDLVVFDKSRSFRYNQIETEGNDPAQSGESYGTPHDLANIYNNNAKNGVPDGYEDVKDDVKLGRPVEKSSIYKTDKSMLGRDPLGSTGMKDFGKEKNDVKVKPMALENTNNINKSVIEGLKDKFKKKNIIIFESQKSEVNMLNENNLLDDIII